MGIAWPKIHELMAKFELPMYYDVAQADKVFSIGDVATLLMSRTRDVTNNVFTPLRDKLKSEFK